jgi:hypothetical protein
MKIKRKTFVPALSLINNENKFYYSPLKVLISLRIFLSPEKILSSPKKIATHPERIQNIKSKKKISNFFLRYLEVCTGSKCGKVVLF